MVTGIDAKTNPATATLENKNASTDNGSKALAGNLSDFLKLLTTQLKNQDPTAPTDTAQFTQQLIGFSGVEQQLNTNTKLDKLVDSQTTTAVGAQLSSSVNYIGKMAEVEGSTFTVQPGVEPKFSYVLPEGVRNSQITISDSKGVVIGAFQGKTAAGKQDVIWDAKDATGKALPAGQYTVKVSWLDEKGTATAAKTNIVGEVTGVDVSDGKTSLVIDDNFVVSIDKVQSVAAKQQPTQNAA